MRPPKKARMSNQNSSTPVTATDALSESAVEDAAELSTTTCTKCGRDVPTSNFVLHEATCNRARVSVQQHPLMQEGGPSGQQQSAPAQVQEQDDASGLIELPPPRARESLPSSSLSERSANLSNISLVSDSIGNANNSSSANSASLGTDSAQARGSNTMSPSQSATNNGSDGDALGTATAIGNIHPPQTQSTTNVQSQPSNDAAGSVASAAGAANAAEDNGDVQVGPNQWQCPRCTLVNDNSQSNCDACLAPRNGNNNNNNMYRPPVVENGWVNVTYNPQFQRGRNGIIRSQQTGNGGRFFSAQFQNPMVHNTGRLGTATRVFNGLLNGAIVGSIFAGPAGMILGGLAGAAGGAVVDRARNREADNEMQETRDVANMLANDNGGVAAGTVRVHRGDGYITALARDVNGRHRVIRVRHTGPAAATTAAATSETQNTQQQGPAARSEQQPDNQGSRRATEMREGLERALLEILVQMSYSRDFGPGPGNNIILEPQESFEELIGRFGLGNDNRGTSDEVIDSYPVEVIGEGDNSEGKDKDKKVAAAAASDKAMDTDHEDEDASQFGTCNICLEDYKEGDSVKKLCCPHHPHSFHKDCIDKWLKLVASCPICKHDVGMYENPSCRKNSSDGNGAGAAAAAGR